MYPRRTMRDATSRLDETGAAAAVAADLDAPLVDRATGAVRVGLYPGPLGDPNIEDARFPHTLELRFEPSGAAARPETGYGARISGRNDVDVCCDFLEHVRGRAAAPAEAALFAEALGSGLLDAVEETVADDVVAARGPSRAARRGRAS